MENSRQVEVEENMWCSWCFEKGTHYQIEQKYLERNTYRCAYCCNDTKCCTLCTDGMSRCTPDGSDKLCMKCDGTIEKWGIYPSFVEQKGHCSWCFKDTIHLLIKYNYVRRSIYLCSECKHRTLRCRACDTAFARGNVAYDDENCFVCNQRVPNWNDPVANTALLTKKAWCSWCISNSDHTMETSNSVRRDVYNCSACEGRTLTCFTCNIGMTRGAGWDDDCCLVCSHKKGVLEKLGHGLFDFSKKKDDKGADPSLVAAWEALAKKKAESSSRYNDPNFVRTELQRNSRCRRLAFEAGMIRPFLLLVAMTPELRNQVSNFLGWSIFTEKYFGDSHAESWDILSRDRKGMLSRSASVNQKLNPMADDNTYYETLYKVIEAIFKFIPMPPLPHKEAFQASTVSGRGLEAHMHLPSASSSSEPTPAEQIVDKPPVHLDTEKNTLTTNKEKALDAEDSVAPGDTPLPQTTEQGVKKETGDYKGDSKKTEEEIHNAKNTLAIAQLEEFLMAQVHSQQRKTMTKAQRETEDRLMDDSQNGVLRTAVDLMRMKAGLSNKQAIKYGVGVAKHVFEVPGQWGITLMGMEAIQAALPATAVFMSPAIAGLTVMMGPLAIIGLAQLVWSGVNLALGPTLWSLYGPLVLMCNQRIVLALQDMQVENFY
eukprot:Phypoly_transcript_04395.p1 GENE.Phypoly_transcript_04395~~Phypoly_transcript_04395.p1  ORF type:complete len:656 (+),score=79.01 Phypoly_transcript_04395:150-2117(+)